jgi:modulator of FtsH protease
MDAFNEMLTSWQTFYFTVGGAAAALLGLMFVALSLGMPLINEQGKVGMKLFATPSVVYFVSALLLSCVMLIPSPEPPVLAVMLLLGGAAGLVRTIPFVIGLIGVALRNQDFNLGDWLAQVIAPVASYALIVLAAIGFAVEQPSWAFAGLWIGAVLLLACAIANTWSLVVWVVDQRKE